MATLEHSYALNSAVALSLNTLHSSLSRHIYLCKNLCVLIVMVSRDGRAVKQCLTFINHGFCDRTQNIFRLKLKSHLFGPRRTHCGADLTFPWLRRRDTHVRQDLLTYLPRAYTCHLPGSSRTPSLCLQLHYSCRLRVRRRELRRCITFGNYHVKPQSRDCGLLLIISLYSSEPSICRAASSCVILSEMRPRRSVWSRPHSFGTFFSHRLWTFMSHAAHNTTVQTSHFAPGAAPWWVTLSRRPIIHAPRGPLWTNMTSSTKPEVHNVLHCRQRRTEPRPRVTCIENFVKFGRVDFWDMRADRQTDTHSAKLRTPGAK